jgi:thioredoxin 1
MPAPHITDDKFETTVLKAKLPVMVDFYAEWCGPCKLSAPIIDKLADEYKDKYTIVKIDVDQSELSGKYGVMSIPTVVLFKDGKEVGRDVGFKGEKGYRDLLAKAA